MLRIGSTVLRAATVLPQMRAADSRIKPVWSARQGGRQFNFSVRPYDTNTGVIAWQNTFDSGMWFDQAKTVTQGNRVYAAGQVGQMCTDACDYSLCVLDSESGKTLAQDYYDGGGDDFGFHLTASPLSVVAAGSSQNSKGNYDFLIRSYFAWNLFF
jgi:hypothetical protein